MFPMFALAMGPRFELDVLAFRFAKLTELTVSWGQIPASGKRAEKCGVGGMASVDHAAPLA
jgi:hypothetical protein